MQIPESLERRMAAVGIPESAYEMRTRKCILSKEDLPLEKVPWYEHAYLLPEAPGKRNDDFKDYFVFDPVSIVPCLALSPKKEDRILDMCAAPGTKTFIISFLTNNEAKIVANDIDQWRVKRLRANVNRFNLSVEVRNASGRKIEGSFNKILLDAPCSGEGMINKGKKIFDHWSEKRVKLLAKKQKKLIDHAFSILEPGGTLVYSTCTFEPEENEMAVDFLLGKNENAEIEKIDTQINHANGLIEWNGKMFDQRLSACLRIYPHHNNTAGFFVAKIRKG